MSVEPRLSLGRVVVTALVLALAANVLLWWIAADDDYFAKGIAVASGIAAVVIIAANVGRLRRWREEALLLAFAVWTANTIEFALETGVPWENRTRQCGLYAALAILALGAYIATRLQRERAG